MSQFPESALRRKDHVQSAPGARVEMKVLTRRLRAWSARRSLALPSLNDLLDDIAAVCEERGMSEHGCVLPGPSEDK
jgi:hypothetical protein